MFSAIWDFLFPRIEGTPPDIEGLLESLDEQRETAREMRDQATRLDNAVSCLMEGKGE